VPIKKINFKNVSLRVSNQHELYVECYLYDGTTKIGDGKAIVDLRGKTLVQVRDEAKNQLMSNAKQVLETIVPVYNIPDSVPNFSMDVEYEEK